jgi:predicted nucleic acid-binding protein
MPEPKLVLDASALAGWLMPDEAGVDLAPLARDYPVFIAPWLLWAEIRNILIVAERRGRIGPGIVEQALEAIGDLGIVLDTAPSTAALLALCRTHRLTAYDALYLELALREGATLATRDTALARAATAEGLRVV